MSSEEPENPIEENNEDFVGSVKALLSQLEDEPEGYYDDEVPYHERRRRMLEAEGLPLPEPRETIPPILDPLYVENPAPDAEVPVFDHKTLPPSFTQYKYGDASPFTDEQKEFLEKSRESWKRIGEMEKRLFEQHHGEKAKKNIYHPDNRGNLPYWLPQP